MLAGLSLMIISGLSLGIVPKFLFFIFKEIDPTELISAIAGLSLVGALIILMVMLEIIPDPQKMRLFATMSGKP
ncbi:MAG: hypothetical protein P4L79_16115 [Legionella sp.]|uniref:hypothetical protein n=1 Tax=Legionella sp. TaxID=459 RepID=UPI00283CEA87|nr:hypothetical protein [Legionella sp.]